MAKPKKNGNSPKPDLTAPSRDDLVGLMAAYKTCGSEMAAARGRVGQIVKGMEEHGFDSKVFNCIKSLINGKNAQGIAARLRTFDQYVEIMGLRDQGDLVDFIDSMPDTRTEMEKAMDGDEVGGKPTKAATEQKKAAEDRRKARSAAEQNANAAAVDDVAGGGATAEGEGEDDGEGDGETEPGGHLTTFATALKDADSSEAVNRGLELFISDHPELEDEALDLASKRLEALAEQVG